MLYKYKNMIFIFLITFYLIGPFNSSGQTQNSMKNFNLFMDIGMGNLTSIYGTTHVSGGHFAGIGAGYLYYNDPDTEISINVLEPSLLWFTTLADMFLIRVRAGIYFISRQEQDLKMGGYMVSPDFMVRAFTMGNGRFYCGVSLPFVIGEEGMDMDTVIGGSFMIPFGRDVELSEIKKEPRYTISQTEEGLSINISEDHMLLFGYNKSNLEEECEEVLEEVVDIIKNVDHKRILINGHTDNIGEREYNLELSKNRARSVYQYFLEEGIEEGKMTFAGYGMEKPVASNSTEKGRSMNRRCEIMVLKWKAGEKERFEQHHRMGQQAFEKEQYEKAMMEYKEALKIDPDNEEIKQRIKTIKEIIQNKIDKLDRIINE